MEYVIRKETGIYCNAAKYLQYFLLADWLTRWLLGGLPHLPDRACLLIWHHLLSGSSTPPLYYHHPPAWQRSTTVSAQERRGRGRWPYTDKDHSVSQVWFSSGKNSRPVDHYIVTMAFARLACEAENDTCTSGWLRKISYSTKCSALVAKRYFARRWYSSQNNMLAVSYLPYWYFYNRFHVTYTFVSWPTYQEVERMVMELQLGMGLIQSTIGIGSDTNVIHGSEIYDSTCGDFRSKSHVCA